MQRKQTGSGQEEYGAGMRGEWGWGKRLEEGAEKADRQWAGAIRGRYAGRMGMGQEAGGENVCKDNTFS